MYTQVGIGTDRRNVERGLYDGKLLLISIIYCWAVGGRPPVFWGKIEYGTKRAQLAACCLLLVIMFLLLPSAVSVRYSWWRPSLQVGFYAQANNLYRCCSHIRVGKTLVQEGSTITVTSFRALRHQFSYGLDSRWEDYSGWRAGEQRVIHLLEAGY